MALTRIRAQQISNIDYKQAVRVVTIDDVTLSGGAPSTVDGVNLQANDRILVNGQSAAAENGLYRVSTLGTGSNGTWLRTMDADQNGEVEPGMVVMVTEGDTFADTPWKLTTNGEIIIGTTALIFSQFSSGTGVPGGANTQIQFNDSGNFAGSSSLTWSGLEFYANGTANVTGNVLGGNITTLGTVTTNDFVVSGNITGNLLPSANITYDLGSSSQRWNDIWLANSTIYIGNAEISANATSLILTNPQGAQTVISGSSADIQANTVSATGNIIGGNISGTLLTGTLATAAQPNVTSLGTLTSLTVSGNVSTGNISGTLLTGTLATAAQPNVTSVGTLSSLTVSGNVSTGNISGTLLTGTLATAAQPNVTSLGTLTSLTVNGLSTHTGNIDVTGNINVTGNLNYANVNDLVVGDPLIYLGANNTGNLYDLGFVVSYDDGTYQHGGFVRDASDGIWKVFGNVVDEPTTTVNFTSAVYQPVQMGSLSATTGTFSGNVSTGNISGTLLTGTLATAAQPNVTSLGTLTSLTVTGNVSTGNVSGTLLTGTLTTASQPNITSLGTLTSLTASGNISAGNVSGTLLTGTLTTASQPNVTSVGTLSSLTVTGNVSGGNLTTAGAVTGNGRALTSLSASNIDTGTLAQARLANSTFTINDTLITLGGTSTITAGTPGSLTFTDTGLGGFPGCTWSGGSYTTVSYNTVGAPGVAGNNATGTWSISVTGSAATVTTAAQPNITSVGTLTSLSVTGNVTGGNLVTTGKVSATGNVEGSYFVGNGSQLTGISTSTTKIFNGTSEVNIAASGGNANISIGGTANVAVFSATGANISGTLTATGNASAGNLGTAGAVVVTGSGAATSTATGSIRTAGGIGAAGNVYAGAFYGAATGLTSVPGANVTGTVPNANNSAFLNSISAVNLYNNMGETHTTRTAFDATSPSYGFGYRFVQGNTNGPGVNSAAQYYSWYIGLGSDYGATGSGSYGCMFALPRNVSVPYIAVRYNESNSFGAWQKIAAGYADSAGTAGTVTTAAQANITSVGTLSSLTVTGNITGGNLITAGLVSLSSITKTGSNGVGNIGSSTSTFNTVFAKSTSAQYADLAERYQADREYLPGTVVCFGGDSEVTISTNDHDTRIAGVVSTQPAHIMNSDLQGAAVIDVALIGRIPCRVIGPVSKGDRLVSSNIPGVAQTLDPEKYQPGCIIGKSLENLDVTDESTIEIMIGRV
jgi:hypothetical protein